MRKLLLVLLAFISLTATAQSDYFPDKVQFGVTPLSNSTDKLGTLDAQGYLNKSTISVQDLIDGLSPDLSGYVTKTLPEIITGKKSFIANGTQAIQVIQEGVSTGVNIDNLSGGIGLSTDNKLDGVGFYQFNSDTGINHKVDNSLGSTGDTYVVTKSGLGEVFKIDNVGNTTTQKLTAEVIDEDLTADRVIVTDASGELKSVPKASFGGGTSGAIVKDGNGYIIADRTDGAFHGDVGFGAFDLSYNTTLQDAIGQYAFVSGYNVNVGTFGISGGRSVNVGDYGLGSGQNVDVGDYGIGGGYTVDVGNYGIGGGQNVNVGTYGIGGGIDVNVGAFGLGSGIVISAPSYGETAHGSYNTTYNPHSITTFDINDRLFSLGNGTAGNLSNAVEVWKDGRTILDKLEVRTLDENNTATKVLVADDNGKVGYQTKDSNQWVVYGNTGATQSIPANMTTTIENNGNYINYNGSITSLFDTATNQIDLSQAKVGDSLNITVELDITTTVNNQVVYLLFLGSLGTVNQWAVRITNEVYYKNQGSRTMVASFKVPLEFATDITAPAKISLRSDGALDCTAKYFSLTIN